MKIIKPITATDSMILSNNIAPSPYPEWDNITNYSVGDKVKVDAIHNEYQCLITNNNQDPTTNPVDGTGNPYWLDLGSTNDWALFDNRSRKASVNPLSIELQIKPNKLVGSIAFINIEAASLNITMDSVSGGGEVYNQDINLRELVYSYEDYFFSEIDSLTSAVRVDLPLYSDATITITATSPSSDVKIGELVFGPSVNIGLTQYGTSVGIVDFSTKEKDIFGDPIIVERDYADRVDYDILVESAKTASVKKMLSNYRATPLVFIGKEDRYETVVYGFYKRLDMVLQDFAYSSMVLEVEELT